MTEQTDKKLLKRGLIGTAIAGICCFTPALVLTLGAVGLSSLVGWWLEALLFPMLGGSLLMVGYALHLKRKRMEGG